MVCWQSLMTNTVGYLDFIHVVAAQQDAKVDEPVLVHLETFKHLYKSNLHYSCQVN